MSGQPEPTDPPVGDVKAGDPHGTHDNRPHGQQQTDDNRQQSDTGNELENARKEARKWQQRHSTAADQLRQLQEQVKGLVSPETVATKEQALAAVQAERDAAKAEVLKYRVALEAGLPSELAQRLVGADEDELKRDAANLKTMLRPAKGTPDMHAGTQPGSDNGKKPDANAALRMALGMGG